MNVRKYTFPYRDGVDKGPHISVCTNWRGLMVVVGYDGNVRKYTFPYRDGVDKGPHISMCTTVTIRLSARPL